MSLSPHKRPPRQLKVQGRLVQTRPPDHVVRSWTLRASPSSASLARAAVRAVLPAGGRTVEATAILLTDELVANAILHGSGPLRLTTSVAARRIRVSVSDTSIDPPVMVEPDLDAPRESGRGLVLVDALAARWGVTPERKGKQVWFELAWT